MFKIQFQGPMAALTRRATAGPACQAAGPGIAICAARIIVGGRHCGFQVAPGTGPALPSGFLLGPNRTINGTRPGGHPVPGDGEVLTITYVDVTVLVRHRITYI